jgi:transposase
MSERSVKRTRALQRELEAIRAERDALKRQHSEIEKSLKHSEMEREYLKFQLEKLKNMLFGRRSEKLTVTEDGFVQLELFEKAKAEIEVEEVEETETVSYERKKRRGNRRPIPETIHREQIEIDVGPEDRRCPDCGEEMTCIGHDTSEDLDYIPAVLFIIEYLLKKYACKKCQSGVVQATRPPRPLPKARPAAGLLAYILVSKYHDHLPLHRLERIFARHGMEISRKTLCDWVGGSSELLRPIVEAMKRRMLEARLLQADESPTPVKDPDLKGKTARYWIWTYGIPGGEVVLDFTRGRSAKDAERFLGDYSGKLQSDSYSVYKSLERRGKCVHVGCWSHARRRFYDSRKEQPEFAQAVLAAIRKLFEIERYAKAEGIVGRDLVALRRRQAKPILRKIRKLLQAKQPHVIPKSGIGDAIKYALRNWKALLRYVYIPEAEISNNLAENSIRGLAVGRKNWLWIGHPNAGPRAAIIFSLVESCRRLGVEPFEYLRSVIDEMARNPERAPELTPQKWLERKTAAAAASAEKATTAPSV